IKPPREKPPSQRRDPAGEAAQVAKATRLLVAMGRQRGLDDAAIRAEVERAVKDALTGAGRWKQVAEVDGRPTEVGTSAGIYRLIMNNLRIDRGDQRRQET